MRGPVDINGLPRTGTTALANMMSLDPQFRCLRSGSSRSRARHRSPRAKRPTRGVCRSIEENEQLSPELKAMHLYEVDATVEDSEVARDGVPRPAVHGAGVRLPRVVARGRPDLDLRLSPAGREAPRSRDDRRDLWLFKAPHHNFHLEAILAAYPDARFVMTHRDPAKSVPSWASIVSTIFPRRAA